MLQLISAGRAGFSSVIRLKRLPGIANPDSLFLIKFLLDRSVILREKSVCILQKKRSF